MAVREFATVVEKPKLAAREYDAELLDTTTLQRMSLTKALLHKDSVWHINDLFSAYCLVAAFLGLVFRKDVIICPHGMIDAWAMSNGKSRLKRLVLRILNVFAGCGRLTVHALNSNEAACAKLFFRNALAVVTVPNSVPTDILELASTLPSSRDQNSALIIGCFSRISPKKNQMELVQLADKIRNERPDLFDSIEFRIDGDFESSEYVEEILSEISRLDLANKVKLGGSVRFNDRGSLLLNYDIFLFPSKSEGMPYVILEALALGVTPVVSNSASCDFVAKYGGIVYEKIEDVVALLPSGRPELNSRGLDVAGFLVDYDKRKITDFFRGFDN